MEAGGSPNAIHVSAEFAAALREAGLPEGLLLVPSAAVAAAGPGDDDDGSCFLESTYSPDVAATPATTVAPLTAPYTGRGSGREPAGREWCANDTRGCRPQDAPHGTRATGVAHQ